MSKSELERNDNENLAEISRQLKKEHNQLRVRKFLHNKLALSGGIITLLVIGCAVFAPLLTSYDPLDMVVTDRLLAPSADHIFGTDTFGRDLFSRVLYGARVSIGVGFSCSILTMILGTAVGLYASYYRWLDNLLMRVCEGLKAIPATLLAIALMAVLGASTRNVIISLVVVSIPDIARISRSAALLTKEQTYIEAMYALGAKPGRIIWRNMLPNVVSPVIVQGTYIFATAIIVEAALSFLGVGVPAPAPSWGNILSEGKTVIYNSWWMIVFPGVSMAMTVLGLNMFGDGIRDLIDPMTH